MNTNVWIFHYPIMNTSCGNLLFLTLNKYHRRKVSISCWGVTLLYILTSRFDFILASFDNFILDIIKTKLIHLKSKGVYTNAGTRLKKNEIWNSSFSDLYIVLTWALIKTLLGIYWAELCSNCVRPNPTLAVSGQTLQWLYWPKPCSNYIGLNPAVTVLGRTLK